MTEKMIVSWDEYNKTVEKLAIQLDESGYKPTILVGIMRGAAPMIDVLSRIFKLKCAYPVSYTHLTLPTMDSV